MLTILATAAEAAPLATGSGPNIPWGRILLAFLFCLVLAIAAIGFIRVRNGMPLLPDGMSERLGQPGGEAGSASRSDRLQITQRLSVTPASQLVVLKRGKQNYVLHLTNNGATEIDRFHDDAQPDQTAGGST